MIPWSKIQKSFHPNNYREIEKEKAPRNYNALFCKFPATEHPYRFEKYVTVRTEMSLEIIRRTFTFSRGAVEVVGGVLNVTTIRAMSLASLIRLSYSPFFFFLPYRKLSMGFHYNRQLSDELCSNWNRNDCTVSKVGEDLETREKEWVKKSSKFCIVWHCSNWNCVY